MAHRDGMSTHAAAVRPQPPDLLVGGASIPKIIGQLRNVRNMLSEREQRIDAEELEDFLEVERLEHEAHVQEDKEEREATEAQKQYYVNRIGDSKSQLREMVLKLREESRNIQQLKKQRADITIEAKKRELWAARLELGFVREDDTRAGCEELFDPKVVKDDEEFIFASLPSNVQGLESGGGNSDAEKDSHNAPLHSNKTASQGELSIGSPVRSPTRNPEAYAKKQHRMRILTINRKLHDAQDTEGGSKPLSGGWASQGASDLYHLGERKIVLQKQMSQLKHHVRLLMKAKSEAMSPKCPVPITTAIARAVDEVGQLDEQDEFSEDFHLYPPPPHSLLLTELRRKTWAYKLKVAMESRLRLLVIVKNHLHNIAMQEMEPPEPIFKPSAEEREVHNQDDSANHNAAARAKKWVDRIRGPQFDYDYASIDRMGHPGVVGFTVMTKAALQPLRDASAAAKDKRWKEEENLRQVREAAESEQAAQRMSLEHEISQNELCEERMSRGVQEARHLDSQLQLNEEELMKLRRKRDETEVDLTRVTRQQVRVVILVWRAFTCAARPEVHPANITHAHVKRMIAAQEIPEYVTEIPERPKCKRSLPAMAQEVRKLGGIGGDELEAMQPWLGACFAPPNFKGDIEGTGQSFVENLELEHVYGYRGYDCRSNVFHLRTGEAVYHAGSFGIAQNLVAGPDQHRQVWFKGVHHGQITCAALHPDGATVATAESSGSVDEYPRIYVWRVSNGDTALVGTLNDPMNKRVTLLEGVISCISFSKGGRYLVAIGDTWPRQSLVVYEWDTDKCGAILKHDLGSQKVLAVAVNPYTDTIVVSGDRFLHVMYSPDHRKQLYREVVGQLRWQLTRADLQYQAVAEQANDVAGGLRDNEVSKGGRDQFLFQHADASGKPHRAYKQDIFGGIPEQDESGRDILTISELGFERLLNTIRESLRSARNAIDSNKPVSAIADCKCGLRSCELLSDLVERGLVREMGVPVVDSIGPRQAVARLEDRLRSLLLEGMDRMDAYQSTFDRTYDIDLYLEGMFDEMRASFVHLLDGTMPNLLDSFQRTEAGFKQLVQEDKDRRLCVDSCHNYNRLGAPYWRINVDSPVLHTPKVQAVFCIAFSGYYTVITGTEDGSLYFWDGSELVGATPLHDDAIVDMSIDITGLESSDYFHLITAGYDGTVRLSRCDRFEQGLRNQYYSGIVLQQIHKVVLPSAISTGQPSPAVSLSNVVGLDKFSGLPCTDWIDKPRGHPVFTMKSGVQFSADAVATSKHPFIVGTADNNLFYISFNKRDSRQESESFGAEQSFSCLSILQSHSRGAVACVSSHPRQSNIMFSGGEDGVARLWDVPTRSLKSWYRIKNNSITCSDFAVTGDVVAAGLSKGGFVIFDSATLLPVKQVVSEFEVLVLPHQDDDPLTCNTLCGPTNDSEKASLRRLDVLVAKRNYLEHKSKGKDNIPADSVPEWEEWCHEIHSIESRLLAKQQKHFKGSYFAPDNRSNLSRRRTLIADLDLKRLSGAPFTKGEQEDLYHATIKERQQERVLVADIEYQIQKGSVSIKFESALSKPPIGRATIQNIDEAVRHSKRSALVIKFTPDNRILAVAGVDTVIYLHQRSCLGEVTCKVAGHTGPVLCIDWAVDSLHVQTNTENHELRFWTIVKPERKPWYAEELRAKQMPADLGWATQTCPMGWSVLGIQTTQGMPPRTNIPLHSAFTYTGSYIAFGDNSRRITLARFPCPSLDRLRKTYSGHCSPIKAVQFIDNCNRLVTCGVGDSSIVQWRVGQDPEVIVKPEVVKKPPVVLHGDVSSKSASWCAVCREVNCENPNHGGLETANAVKEMVAGGGSYRGDKEEGHGEAGIPQRPWEHTMLAPKGSAPKGFVASNADHPIEDLELEHVFGFQGSDRKCNAKILKTGEVIYTAGCNAIVSNNYTRKQRHFTQHQSPILSIAINDDKFTICSVSNGQLPSIFVWDSITMEVKHNLRNLFFTDFLLVTFAGHRSEKLLVVGNDDMHSLIIVDWDTETILKSSHSQGDAVTTILYNPYASDDAGFVPSMVTLGEQRCFFWDLRYSKCEKAWGLDKLRADFGQKSAISMASGLFLGRVTLFTGSYEGKIYVWEREKLQTTVKAHSGPIFEMKLNVEQKSFITCSSDGLIKIWSTLPGGVFAHEILQVLQVNVVIVHVSVMDESREALGYLMLKPHESLKDVRNLIETSHSSSVYIDNRIRSMIQNVREFLFVTNRGKNLIREKNEELNLAKDLYSEICLVLGQDRIDMMIDSEEVTDIDRLVTRPEGIVDQCKVRMASFEMHHSEIRSVDWHNDSIVFGTQEHLLFGLDSLKGRRSPEQLSNAISGSEVSAMCSHPYLPLFYTASTDGVVQIWDQESKYCTQTRSFTVAVQAMDIAPDGYYLLLATSTGCLALAASNLEELHWIHYRPQRICSIRAVRFSFDGHHLATGTSEGRVDYFDVHGRIRLTEWLTEKLEIELDAGGLEVDFSDGVLLCKLIEVVLFPFTDGRMVTELKSYAIVVDRPPSLAAWKNRPKTYAQKVSLMGEGLEIVLLAAAQAKFIYDRTLADQDDPTYRPWESREQKEDTKGLILQRLQIIRKGESKFHARDLVGDLKPVDRANLFEFCRFVKAMDVTILNAQRDDLQELKVLRTEMQNFSSQSKLAERDQSKGLDSINETAQRLKFAIASHNVLTAQALELDSKLQERQQRHFADRFNEIQALVAKSQKKYNLLVYKMDRAKEEIFIFLGSGKGPSPHNKPVTEIDWSKDGLVAQSVALDSGELNYWKTNGLQQLWPEDCANADWATHHSPLGWAVSGLTRFECMEKQYFTKLNRGPPDSDSSHLLGIGDNTGRVLITQYPFPCNVAEIDLYMEDTFDLEIGFDRITVEAESELISELAVLLTVSKTRLSLIKSTGPAKLTVNIAPPICSEDKRSAFELSVAALACLEHGKMRPFKLLRHCKLVDVPAAFTGIGHSEPVAAIAFDGMGERILSVGKSDMTICVWRILRPENREKGRKIHDKVQRHVEVRICQAVEFLRLGDGTRIEESIIHFLQEWDIAKSGLVTKAVDPVVRLVKELQTTEMKADLTRRGVDIVDLNERDEIAARLCTAMTTPETMTIVEIRSELAKAKVPSGNVFERADLIRLLLSQRQEGTEYPRPIPFEYQRVAPTHKLIIARAKSRWAPSTGGAKHKVSLKDREKEALEILDAVCNLDMLEAQSLGVDQKLWSLIVLIKSNRLEIAATCARNKLYHDTVRKGININEIQTKNPNDVDWLIAGVPPETDPKSLKKGGELYEAAAKAAGGTLLSGRWYQFKDFPGREFEYVRYNERWEFSDQLIEHWSAALSSKTNRQPQRVSGLKNSRWGSLFYAKSLGNIVKAQSLPLQLRKNSQKILSTAYLYQVPVGIPRLRDRVLPSAVQIEDFFTSLDKSRVGSIDMESFEGVVEASMHQLHQCEVLGLPVQNSKDALIIKELIFPCCVLAADSGADSDDMGIKSKLQCTDLFDFFFPNINVLGHLTFKVRIVRLGGEVKIGFVDVSRISRGVPLESDWLWPGHPTWYIDSEGSLYQFGRKVSQATTRLVEKQIILADLDQNLGVLRFFKEGSPDPIGMLAGVQGFVSCAVQFTTLDDEIELMPF